MTHFFQGGPFLLEDFLSVEGQWEYPTAYSTEQDLIMNDGMCPATQDILSQSYVLYTVPVPLKQQSDTVVRQIVHII